MFRKMIAMILALSSCLVLCACQPKEAEPPAVEVAYTFEKTISPVRMHSSFGVVDLNADPNYVSEGVQSIQLTPKTTVDDQLYVFFPFSSSKLRINYTDLNYVSAVDIDVYAPVDMTIEFGMYFSDSGTLKAEPTSVSLKKGWTTVNVPIQHSLIALQYDLMECRGMYAKVGMEAVEAAQSVYLDNIRVTTQTEPVEVDVNILLDEWEGYCELADFEHAYQQIIAMPYTTYNAAALPEVKVVKAADDGLEAPSGERILRVETYPRTTSGTNSTWTQLAFADQWFQTLDISRFKDQGYELKFDVYQEGAFSTLLELNLYHDYGMDWGGINTQEGKWIEYSAPLDSFANWLDNPKQFVFSWLDWNAELGDVCVFYIDNIRIEKES